MTVYLEQTRSQSGSRAIPTWIPKHGLGFNIRGGTDCLYVPGDPGIFITRIRKEGAVAETKQIPEWARLLEIDGQSLIDVKHGRAVSM